MQPFDRILYFNRIQFSWTPEKRNGFYRVDYSYSFPNLFLNKPQPMANFYRRSMAWTWRQLSTTTWRTSSTNPENF